MTLAQNIRACIYAAFTFPLFFTSAFVAEAGTVLGAQRGEIPAASVGMTELALRGCDGSRGTLVGIRGTR